MWESPIELQFGINDMVSEFIKGQTEQTEKYIVESVQSVGIKINKEELIKAINYDRNQYEKGYQDGLNADRWISVKDKLPDEEGQYLCIAENRYGRKVEIELFIRPGGFISRNKITHWMPLPEMPKGE